MQTTSQNEIKNIWKKDRLEKLRPGDYCYFCLHPNPRKIIGPERIVYRCLNCNKTAGFKLKLGSGIKTAWHNDELMHFTAGVLLKDANSNKFLLIKKRTNNAVISVVAGHLRDAETPTETLLREVNEETDLTITDYRLLTEELVENHLCRRGAPNHHWYLFFAYFRGVPHPDIGEIKYFREYSWEEMMKEEILSPPVRKMLAGLSTADVLALTS